MLQHEEVIQYLHEHPNTSRPALYNQFLGKTTGKERRKLTHRLLTILSTLQNRGMITETDIQRARKGNAITDSKINLTLNKADAAKDDAKADLRHAKSIELEHTDKQILSYLMKSGRPSSLTDISVHTRIIPSTAARLSLTN